MKNKTQHINQSVIFFIGLLMIMIVQIAHAIQQDAAYRMALKKNTSEWQTEDTSLDDKLQALENKFGKKTNILYILTNDIGWGGIRCVWHG